jgi:hypothetical protein
MQDIRAENPVTNNGTDGFSSAQPGNTGSQIENVFG